jgi:hypothetical protein
MKNKTNLRLYFCLFFNLKYITSSLCILFLATIEYANAQSTNLVLYRDQAFEFQLPAQAVTVIIANPEIADIVTQGDLALVLIGKKNGRTNLLIRDAAQTLIANVMIDVQPDTSKEISIYQGVNRIEYICGSQCRKIAGDQEKAGTSPISDVPPAASKFSVDVK